jgi:hypothetical protein
MGNLSKYDSKSERLDFTKIYIKLMGNILYYVKPIKISNSNDVIYCRILGSYNPKHYEQPYRIHNCNLHILTNSLKK